MVAVHVASTAYRDRTIADGAVSRVVGGAVPSETFAALAVKLGAGPEGRRPVGR